MRVRSPLAVLLALLLCVAVAACGDDDNGAEDAALAERVVLTAADVPDGFVADPEDDEADDETDEEDEADELSACVGAEGVGDDTADAESPTFSKGQESQLSSFASVFPGEDEATEAFDIVDSDVFGDCVQDLLRSSIEEEVGPDSGFTIGAIEVSDVDAPDAGDAGSALRFTLPISAAGLELAAVVDFVLFREGRVVAGLFAFNLGEPLAPAIVADLVELMAGRAAA